MNRMNRMTKSMVKADLASGFFFTTCKAKYAQKYCLVNLKFKLKTYF